jgi:hypothetical protein
VLGRSLSRSRTVRQGDEEDEMPEYEVDTPELLDAAAWILVAMEDMPGIRDRFNNAVGQVQAKAPVSIGSFGERWADEMDILRDMMEGFEGALVSSAEVYAETDMMWARLLGYDG